MMPKIKNIILFAAIGAILILGYIFFIRGNSDQASLVSVGSSDTATAPAASSQSAIAQDFLAVLLNVKSIKLDDSIFSDPAFMSLSDSNIELVQDGTEGRTNPFAPLGFDNAVSLPINSPVTTPDNSVNKTSASTPNPAPTTTTTNTTTNKTTGKTN